MELNEAYIAELKRVFGGGRPTFSDIKAMLALADIERPLDKSILDLGRSFANFKSLKITKRRFRFRSQHISIFPAYLEDGERILATTSHLFPQTVWFFHHRQGRGIRLLSPGALLGVAPYGPPSSRLGW